MLKLHSTIYLKMEKKNIIRIQILGFQKACLYAQIENMSP